MSLRPRKLLLLSLIVLSLAACDSQEAKPLRPVLSVEVEQYSEDILGRFAGTIQARYETVRAFRIGGRMVRRLVDVGDRVEPSDLLAELDPSEQQTILTTRQAELAEVEARYQNAEAAVRRQQTLLNRGVGSKSELEKLQVQLSNLRFLLDQARSAANQAKDRLSYTRLYSERLGVVVAWHAEVGQTLVAGQDVLTLAQSQVREAVFDLPAGFVEGLPPQIRLQIRAELDPSATTAGQIRLLTPQADPITRTRQVRIALDQAPRAFHLGTSVILEITAPVSPRSRLPVSALREHDGYTQVWVIDPLNRTVGARKVQLLARSDRWAIVGEGLASGERVVVAGVNSLKDGQVVKFDEEAK